MAEEHGATAVLSKICSIANVAVLGCGAVRADAMDQAVQHGGHRRGLRQLGPHGPGSKRQVYQRLCPNL